VSIISFRGQVAIVTGGGRGLGRAYALELASRGASVVVNDVGLTDGRARADQVAAEIEVSGGKALASCHDISTPEGGQALVDAAVGRFGTVDVLINNAGFLRPSPFEDTNVSDLQAVVGVHLLGAFFVTLPAWRIMRAKRYGRIMMTASGSVFGQSGNSNYAAAKAGILGLTQTLALEGQDCGIQINCIFPLSESQISADASQQSHRYPRLVAALAGLQGRRPPMSVAHLVVYLVSNTCSISGCTYSAAAGRYARVFLGLSDGWIANDVSKVSAEEIRQHIEQINDTSDFEVPLSAAEELEAIVARIPRAEVKA